MFTIKTTLRTFFRTWTTGLLYIVAGFGFVFYALLLVIRIMQTRTKFFLPILLVSLVAAACLWVASALFPAGKSGAEVPCLIGPGHSIKALAHTLKREHVISSEMVFLAVVKIKKLDRHIMAGRYVFFVNDGVLRAIERLAYPSSVELSVTIPEGLTMEQIAGIFSRDLSVDSAMIVAECYDTAVARRHGITASSLEGYLYPDTYRFSPVARPREIVERLLTRFDTVWAEISRGSHPGSAQLTREEIVALASIVEKEAALRSEQSRIAGVFHNRLRIGMPLGADPTVRYIFRKFSGPLYKSELKNLSPYNTRVHVGLPPGPICSPGKGALAAALSPASTKDLFFVAKWDGSGAHDFSVSYEDHLKKTYAIRRANETRKNMPAESFSTEDDIPLESGSDSIPDEDGK